MTEKTHQYCKEKIGNLCKLIMGQSPSSSFYNDIGMGLPFLQGKAEFQDVFPKPTKYCSQNLKVVDEGTILLSVRAPVGDVNIADQKYVIGRGLTGLQPLNKNDLDSWYLFFCLKKIKREFEDKSSGSTFQSINKNIIENTEIYLPSIYEQKAISKILYTIQNAIEIRKRELELQRELKEALIAHLFTYGTRNEPLKVTEIGRIPESWEILRLDEVSSLKRGKFTHRPRNDPKFYGGDIPFIQTGDVTASNGFITKYSQTLNELGLSVSKIFPMGTIVITIAANIGYTGILGFDAAFPDSLVGISAKDEICESKFLHYYFTKVQREMDKKAPRGTQKNINIQFLSPWPIPLPDIAEQKKIASILEFIDQKIDLISKEIRLNEELFKALLEEIMTGKISVLPLIGKGEAV